MLFQQVMGTAPDLAILDHAGEAIRSSADRPAREPADPPRPTSTRFATVANACGTSPISVQDNGQ
jgi:hypothetical protein